jgi:hypothetical protein
MSRDYMDPDEVVRRAMREAAHEPPTGDVDWMALQARISAAARPTLDAIAAGRSLDVVRVDEADAARRPAAPRGKVLQGAAVWQPLAGWSPFGIPLAAAATVLLMLGSTLVGGAPAATASAGASFRTIEEEFASGLGGGAGALLAGGTDDMLDVALFLEGEDW